MGYTIDDSHPDYIRVTVTSVLDKSTVLAAMSKLVNHPDYTIKHSLWDLSEATMGLTLQDLKEIIGVMRLYRTPKRFANKSSLLVSGTMESAMVKVFIGMSTLLPFEYKAFTCFADAEKFLKS